MSAVPTRLDRLSALLEGLSPRVEISPPHPGDGPRAFNVSRRQMLHLHLVAEGRVQLAAPPHGTITAVSPAIVICRADLAHVLHAYTPPGASHRVIHGRAYLDGPVASLLLAEFAVPLVVPLDVADSSLSLVLQLMASEVLQPRCGQPALMDRAGDILFIGLLRHLIARPMAARGLLSGLSDPRIAAALVAMHESPQGDWNLGALAGEAGMSRTSFATRFHDVMSLPPGKYLAQLRLSIAQRAVGSGLGLKQAANQSGYSSVSALSRALSRARLRSPNPIAGDLQSA